MFSDFQKQELSNRFLLILQQEKAGRADSREGLAEKMAEAAREYLATQFTAKEEKHGGWGIHRSSDVQNN